MKEVFDALYDENNNDNIILTDSNGKTTIFEQIALIPIKEKVYAILKPLDCDDIPKDEAWPFELDEENNRLIFVSDEKLIDKIFDIYYSLLEK